MAAKSGKDYINRINAMKTNVRVDGNPVTGNISEHSAFKEVMKSQAALYNIQDQVVSRQIIKTEFILGIVLFIIETINIGEYQHVQEKTSEIIIALESMKALVIKSEVEAEIDEWGCVIGHSRRSRVFFIQKYSYFVFEQ